jgi:hypothetical protein
VDNRYFSQKHQKIASRITEKELLAHVIFDAIHWDGYNDGGSAWR